MARILKGAQILVVEDNDVNRQVVIEILESIGAVLAIAKNGKEAVQAVKDSSFDAVVMDIQMPEMDGFTATKKIRTWEQSLNMTKRLPIIAMTALAMKGDRESCIQAGMNDYIAKPLSTEKLLSTLSKWVETKDTDIDNLPYVDSTVEKIKEVKAEQAVTNKDEDIQKLRTKIEIFTKFKTLLAESNIEVLKCYDDLKIYIHGALPQEEVQAFERLITAMNFDRALETFKAVMKKMGIPVKEDDVKKKTTGKTILIVDDNPDNILIMSEELMSDYNIRVATCGKKAMDLALTENPPDLILLDIMMPQMTGYEVCKKLKADEQAKKIPVVFITAKTGEYDEIQGFEIGGVDFISKPINTAVLKARIRSHLELSGQQSYLEAMVKKQTNELIKSNIQLSKVNTAYRRFVPRKFLNLLQKENIESVKLGDQIQKELTIMFSDIRSFTTMSEDLTPKENFDFINSYLKRIGPVIRVNKGFIDKYIGDAIMAIFPEKTEDAVIAAISIRRKLIEYNIHRKKMGYLSIDVGMGIHTGVSILGTVGEAERMEGTVISDSVNIASRLEGLSKIYGISIIISESALFSLKDPTLYNYRFLGKVNVKGRHNYVSIFEIFDADQDEIFEKKKTTLSEYDHGIHYFSSGKFDDAMLYFKKVLDVNPRDSVAVCMYNRSEFSLKNGVPPDWEGIMTMQTK